MSIEEECPTKEPSLIGNTVLVDAGGNRFKIKYRAPADLHPYYDRLIKENKEQLLEEVWGNESSFDVTFKFEEEAKRLYRKDLHAGVE